MLVDDISSDLLLIHFIFESTFAVMTLSTPRGLDLSLILSLVKSIEHLIKSRRNS